MATWVVRIFYCLTCKRVFEKRTLGYCSGKCPFCGSSAVIYRGDRKIQT